MNTTTLHHNYRRRFAPPLILTAIVLALATLACGSDPPRKRRVGATCAEAVSNSIQVGLGAKGRDLTKLSELQRERMAVMVMATSESCVTTAWSREAIECLAGAENAADIGRCKGTLTRDQERATEAAVEDVSDGTWRPHIPSMPADDVATSAPSDPAARSPSP